MLGESKAQDVLPLPYIIAWCELDEKAVTTSQNLIRAVTVINTEKPNL